METTNKKIAGIQFTNTGVMIEKPYCEDQSELRGQHRIAEEKFTGELLEIAKRVIKYRMAHCFKQLHANLANAKVVTPQSIIWSGGHFEVPVWEQMDAILQMKDVRDLNRMQCQQLIRSLMFNCSGSYWLSDHDENWNIVKGSDNIKCTEEFKGFITEHILCCEVNF